MDHLVFDHENRLIRKSSLRYIFPPMLGMIFAQIAPLVDAICVSGGMGTEALAALGTVGPVFYIFNVLAALGGIGCGVMISRCSGAGEKHKAAVIFTRTIFLLTVSTVILSVLAMVFVDPVLALLRATPEDYDFSRTYLMILFPGSIFMVLNFAGDYILSNDNNQNLAMAGDIVGAVVNMIIDFVGVHVFHMGIEVVAFGTVFGSFCCVLVYMLHFRKTDRLCRFVRPVGKKETPRLMEMVKPGIPEALMYVMLAVELLIQNFVLIEGAGTTGLGNSAVIENLQLVITIIIAGATDAVYPMASAYCGEQNRSGMLMVKRMLGRIGMAMLLPIMIIVFIFPGIVIFPYSIDDPVMLQTLPMAVRIVCVSSLIGFINALLTDYLSAVDQEKKASMALVVQYLVQFPVTFLLSRMNPMDAPWYAFMAGNVAVLVFLCFFCDHLPRGIGGFYKENLICLSGGRLSADYLEQLPDEMEGILTPEQSELLESELIRPLITAIPEGKNHECSIAVLRREDDRVAVILRYESRKDYLGGDDNVPETDEDEEPDVMPDTCIRSEFLGMRRMMIVFGENPERSDN